MNGLDSKNKKKKKAPVMSLEQFNQMDLKKEKSTDSDGKLQLHTNQAFWMYIVKLQMISP